MANIIEFEQGGVDIFLLRAKGLALPENFQYYYEQMSDARRSKVDRQRTDKGKCLSLGAGVLLDEGLKKYGLREREVRIAAKENGKPYLLDYPRIHFNLSHSKEMVMAVFAGSEVGCDIEYEGELKLQVAKRFFCPDEYAYLVSQPKERQKELFYRLWTLKESFMKVTGQGLKLMPNQFAFRFGCEADEDFAINLANGDKMSYLIQDGSGITCYRQKVEIRQNVDDKKYRFAEYFFEGYHMAVSSNLSNMNFQITVK